MEGKLFKEIIHNYGVVKTTDKIPFQFEMKEGISPDEIDFIYPDCGGCTTVKLDGNKIVGEIDASRAGAHQNGNNQITKIVYIKKKDGQPYFKANPETKMREYNQDMELERLQCVGVIVKDPE